MSSRTLVRPGMMRAAIPTAIRSPTGQGAVWLQPHQYRGARYQQDEHRHEQPDRRPAHHERTAEGGDREASQGHGHA